MEDFGLMELRIVWSNPPEEGEKSTRKVDVGYEIKPLAAQGRVRIDMTFADVEGTSEDAKHYEVFARVLGFFRFDDSLSKEEKAKLLYSNGLAMLFSSLRGVLLTMSGCFPPGFRYILPTLNLQEVVRQVEEKRKAMAEGAKAPQIRETMPAPVKAAAVVPVKRKTTTKR
jgi:hypothetical protein